MRWNTGYESGEDGELEHAAVEASSAADAINRLREVVGSDTDVIFVVPDAADIPDEDTYQDFLNGPNSSD